MRVGWLATDSERRRIVNLRKVYPVGSGLTPLFDGSGKANIGRAIETVETAVRIDRERRDAEVHHMRIRDGYEIELLIQYAGGQSEWIQGCVVLDDPNTRAREGRALEVAACEFSRVSLLLITGDDSRGSRAYPRGQRTVLDLRPTGPKSPIPTRNDHSTNNELV